MASRIIKSPPTWPEWWCSPPGRYLLDWEQRLLDQAVANRFGYHALQLGMPQVDALQANRMPHRWLALDAAAPSLPPPARLALHTDFAALPFAEGCLDLVVLPHTLECNADPHATLREVARVLVPEGRVVLSGFNPLSLWGLRQLRSRWMGREPYLPDCPHALTYRRLHDWLQLLDLEVEFCYFGGYRPALRTQRWLGRLAWMDRLGQRWWPILGAVYLVVAVKRVHGMRLIRPGWKHQLVRAPGQVVSASRASSYHRPSISSRPHPLEPR